MPIEALPRPERQFSLVVRLAEVRAVAARFASGSLSVALCRYGRRLGARQEQKPFPPGQNFVHVSGSRTGRTPFPCIG
ncbi:hypothetical protein ACF07T_15040 [Streptomyces sp. NPDC015184]|uniref:hypothetical protein n=1 Tax=Streptomyces sp. NPDC015184 TaxID=3364946 RepID=UPI0036FC0900